MSDRPLLYPIDPWRIRELTFDPAYAARNETIFSLANGHLGLRGNLDEEAGNVSHGTYVNGFFEETPIVYGETAYGFARNHQVLLNVADGKRIQLWVGDDPLDLSTGTIDAHERSLDLRTGILSRTLRWRAPGGAAVEISVRRLVSLTRPSIAAIEYVVTSIDGHPPVRIVSAISSRVRNQEEGDDPRVGAHLLEGALQTVHQEASGTWGAVVQRTRATGLALVAAADHDVYGDELALSTGHISSIVNEEGVALTVDARLPAGACLGLVKYLAYCTSRDGPEKDLVDLAREGIEEARRLGFEGLVADQEAEMRRFWADSDVEIDGDPALQQGVRFNLFSLFQSAGRDGRTSLAAKGLTGEGYEGHYFWDTEVFALPFFIYTQPAIARSLLVFRCRTLDKARRRAAEMNQRGALYPWRTIGGEEASAYFPAGTAQYHINAAIAHAMRKYVAVTGDRELLLEGGAEVVVETARLWADLGDYIPAQGGAFCINEVTGPDEYTALVNNNCYTNLMARAHLRYAADLVEDLLASEAPAYHALARRIGLQDGEVEEWRRAADAMRIPRDASLGIHAQDDSFLTRARWDLAGTAAADYPLLLHFHPLVIYRHQVLKQPDVVLAQVLLSRQFSAAEKRRNFDYYDPLTTGDSSLSPCIQSVAAAELGYADKAYAYFMRTARMDLDDVNGNVSHGVHTAAMAGSWIALVCGFAGLRDDDGQVSFSPRLPAAWRRLRFRLRFGGDSLLQVALTADQAEYEILAGGSVEILHDGRPIRVEPDRPTRLDLRPRLACVIFDLDGVITDTAEHHFRAWQQLAAELDLPFDRELNERLKGVSRMDSLQIILDNADRDASLPERVRLAERKNAYYRELIASITPHDVLPGIRALLDELRAHGVRTGVASASQSVFDVIRSLGIESLVDRIIDPASVLKGKPDPEIFLTAAEQLGARPEDCIGIEDARVGIEAIKAAGMVAVGVGPDLPGADWRVRSTADITYEALAALVGPETKRGG
jgi:beta-phosphoglucomutase